MFSVSVYRVSLAFPELCDAVRLAEGTPPRARRPWPLSLDDCSDCKPFLVVTSFGFKLPCCGNDFVIK